MTEIKEKGLLSSEQGLLSSAPPAVRLGPRTWARPLTLKAVCCLQNHHQLSRQTSVCCLRIVRLSRQAVIPAMLFRIVDIPGKDKGVVCTEAVPRGTLLIAEELVVRYDNTKAGLSNFPTYFNSLSEEARASLLAFLPTAWNEDLLLSRINHFLPVDGPLDEAHAGFFPSICKQL